MQFHQSKNPTIATVMSVITIHSLSKTLCETIAENNHRMIEKLVRLVSKKYTFHEKTNLS